MIYFTILRKQRTKYYIQFQRVVCFLLTNGLALYSYISAEEIIQFYNIILYFWKYKLFSFIQNSTYFKMVFPPYYKWMTVLEFFFCHTMEKWRLLWISYNIINIDYWTVIIYLSIMYIKKFARIASKLKFYFIFFPFSRDDVIYKKYPRVPAIVRCRVLQTDTEHGVFILYIVIK